MIKLLVGLFFLISGPVCLALEFGADITRLYYQDGAGRTINYDFLQPSYADYGRFDIPSNYITTHPSESAAMFTWQLLGECSLYHKSNSQYRLFVPQALVQPKNIPVLTNFYPDGALYDWNYIQDYAVDAIYDGVPGSSSSGDISFFRAAYSTNRSKLYLCAKMAGSIYPYKRCNYQFFIDRDLDGCISGKDCIIVICTDGEFWYVDAYQFNSYFASDTEYVNVNGYAVSTSGGIEVCVDAAPLGLPAPVEIICQSDDGTQIIDLACSPYLVSKSTAGINPSGLAAGASTNWDYQVSFSACGGADVFQHEYQVTAGMGLNNSGGVVPSITASFLNGKISGQMCYKNLRISAELIAGQDYYWSSNEEGTTIVLADVDPNVTSLDFRVKSNDGRTVQFYYKINATPGAPWTLIAQHSLPYYVPQIAGLGSNNPQVRLLTMPVLSMFDINRDFRTDLRDFASFAAAWMSTDGSNAYMQKFEGPESYDGVINASDLGGFASFWLY